MGAMGSCQGGAAGAEAVHSKACLTLASPERSSVIWSIAGDGVSEHRHAGVHHLDHVAGTIFGMVLSYLIHVTSQILFYWYIVSMRMG